MNEYIEMIERIAELEDLVDYYREAFIKFKDQYERNVWLDFDDIIFT
jgi:hypothetical protein